MNITNRTLNSRLSNAVERCSGPLSGVLGIKTAIDISQFSGTDEERIATIKSVLVRLEEENKVEFYRLNVETYKLKEDIDMESITTTLVPCKVKDLPMFIDNNILWIGFSKEDADKMETISSIMTYSQTFGVKLPNEPFIIETKDESGSGTYIRGGFNTAVLLQDSANNIDLDLDIYNSRTVIKNYEKGELMVEFNIGYTAQALLNIKTTA